jgi:Leucine-rich repeat (LRR) protein
MLSLLQIAASSLVKSLLVSKEPSSWLLDLPTNLKDILRAKLLSSAVNQGHNVAAILPLLVHQKVSRLDLSDMNDLQDIGWLANCTRLTQLKLKSCLRNCNEIGDVFVKLSQLQVLHLHYNADKITDEVLKSIADNCHNLRELDLGHSMQISDDGIACLRQLTKLTCLNLSHTRVTDDGLARLFDQKSLRLTELRVDNCRNITDEGIEIVLEACQEHLNIFLFHACPGTSDRSLTALQTFLRQGGGAAVKQTTWTIY